MSALRNGDTGALEDDVRRPFAARELSRAMSSLAVLAGFAVLASRETGWVSWPTVTAAAATPYVVLLGMFALVLALVARSPLLAMAAVVVTALAVTTQVPLFVADRPHASVPGAVHLDVLTANVHADAAVPASLMGAVDRLRPDVVALEELTDDQVRSLHDLGLDGLLPYRHVEIGSRGIGTGVWSRYPIHEPRALSGFFWPQLVGDLDVPDLGQVTVVVAHPVSPRPGLTGLWAREQARLRSALDGLPGTVIVAGDLNATNDHQALIQLRGDGFVDAADQTGAGLMRTWPQTLLTPPLFALDHVLARGALVATHATVLAAVGSDHRPLFVRLTSTTPPASATAVVPSR